MKHFLFEYLNQGKHIVAFVGAGGKTTIMYQLAEHFAKLGKKVIVTTSTHIWKPYDFFAQSIPEVEALWEMGSYAVIGTPEEKSGKLVQLPQKLLEEYCKLADLVLLEADGAKGLPCKAPASHEPVIIPSCDCVLGVVGLDALGKPLEEVCFRAEAAKALLNVEDKHLMNVDYLVKLLLDTKGTRKAVEAREYFIVLNKCDDTKRKEAAEKICKQLEDKGFSKSRVWIRGEALNG